MQSNEDREQSGRSGLRRGVVAVASRQGQLLVIRRSSRVVAPRAICFPGGGIEPGETEPAALIREIQEELGVAIEPVRRLWRSVTPWNVDLAWWAVRLDGDAVLIPDPAEVEAIYWLTPADLGAMPDLLASNRDFLAALDRGAFRIEEP